MLSRLFVYNLFEKNITTRALICQGNFAAEIEPTLPARPNLSDTTLSKAAVLVIEKRASKIQYTKIPRRFSYTPRNFLRARRALIKAVQSLLSTTY